MGLNFLFLAILFMMSSVSPLVNEQTEYRMWAPGKLAITDCRICRCFLAFFRMRASSIFNFRSGFFRRVPEDVQGASTRIRSNRFWRPGVMISVTSRCRLAKCGGFNDVFINCILLRLISTAKTRQFGRNCPRVMAFVPGAAQQSNIDFCENRAAIMEIIWAAVF